MTVWGVIVGLITLVFGGFMTFAGQRLFRILLPIWGFIFGFWISEAIVAAVLGSSTLSVIIGWLVGLAGGLVLAALAYFLFKFGVVMLAATFGFWLVSIILEAVGVDSAIAVPLLSLVGAVAFGLLAWFGSLERYIVIIATALIGATIMVIGLLFATGQLPVEAFRAGLSPLSLSLEYSTLWIALWLILAIAGALTQFLGGGKSEDEDESEEVAAGVDDAQDAPATMDDDLIMDDAATADDAASTDDAATANDAASTDDAVSTDDAATTDDAVATSDAVTTDDAVSTDDAVGTSDAAVVAEPIVMDDQAIIDDLEAMDDLEPPPPYEGFVLDE
jgi:hypothetical protein